MKKSSIQPSPKAEEAGGKDDARDIQEKLKTSSLTSILAKNAVLLPSGVARVKQLHEVRAVSQTGSSSGSATGKPTPSSLGMAFLIALACILSKWMFRVRAFRCAWWFDRKGT